LFNPNWWPIAHRVINPAGNDKLYLHIAYENKSFVGCLLFDDPGFCALIGNLLKKHINKSIEEIGNLDWRIHFKSISTHKSTTQ
jgi:hypothetical protein